MRKLGHELFSGAVIEGSGKTKAQNKMDTEWTHSQSLPSPGAPLTASSSLSSPTQHEKVVVNLVMLYTVSLTFGLVRLFP
jgi:hypothetical protein